MTVQTFNPETVLVSQKKDGTLPKEFTNIVLKEVAGKSVVMQLGRYVEMNGKQEVTTNTQTDGISAYWVNETEKIQTDKLEVVPVVMRAHKLGIILLASREALTYTWQRFFDEMKPQIWLFSGLTVTGRTVLEQKHQTTTVPGRHGSYYQGYTYKDREIAIKVLLTGKDNLAYRKQYELLNTLVSSQESQFLSFDDEPDRFYHANFKSASEGEEIANQAIITLTFICYDPFKYTDLKSVSGTKITYTGDKDTKPLITLNLTASGNELRILHLEKQQYIRLKGTYQAGNKIVIDMKKRTITQNGRSILPDLDVVNSRFFTFSKGVNTLSINLAHTVESSFREVYL